MYIEARKINLIEAVLKVDNEATLIKLEEVIKTVSNKKAPKKNKLTIFDFAGIISDKEADDMNKIIKETCENINPDDWK